MKFTCVWMAALVLASGTALAQSNGRAMLRPVTGAVRDAGVYHLGLGRWTRHFGIANNNDPDVVVYANTCPTGYYLGEYQHEYFADEGRVPSANGPVVCSTQLTSTNKGCACSYSIDSFQIGYCTGLPHPVDFRIGFQGAYVTCTALAITNSFTLTGLPGAGAIAQGCWLVTVDLDAASQSFTLPADGASCTWGPNDMGKDHLFGWIFENLNSVTDTGTSYAGPLVAGNAIGGPASNCSMVDGTRWDTLVCTGQGGGAAQWPANPTEDGWGMDTQDRFRDESSTGGQIHSVVGPACFFLGGNPKASFHLRLGSNPCSACGECNQSNVCQPIEDNLTCPCNNQPTTPGAGCNALTNPGPTPTGGALMRSSGSAVPYDVGNDSVHVNVSGLPTAATESCLLIQGAMTVAPLVFGQGLRCCGGALKRMTPAHIAPSSGASFWPNFPGQDFFATISERSNSAPGAPVHILPGQTYCYFIQYRQSLFFAPCTLPANFNASQGQTITWHLP